jgi:hypothetical protein
MPLATQRGFLVYSDQRMLRDESVVLAKVPCERQDR